MRNPYVTGGWIDGAALYGRRSLVSYLLRGPSRASWIIGTRRAGKTSLLRQLELMAKSSEVLVPLFFDMQGITTSAEFGRELFYAVEDHAERFLIAGIQPSELERDDGIALLRSLRRQLSKLDRTLLLLVDEAEALVQIGQADEPFLQRLRKALLTETGIRTVLVSTKLLLQLDELTATWPTSPFLADFAPRNLSSLDQVAATMLIRQSQSQNRVEVSDGLVGRIREQTGDQPYLIQLLCHRLWDEKGSLREPSFEDLSVDQTLATFFADDFRSLSSAERRILLAVNEAGLASEENLRKSLDLSEVEMASFAYGLIELGYLRVAYDQLAVGNQFLTNWIDQNRSRLEEQTTSSISDRVSHQLLQKNRLDEKAQLEELLNAEQKNWHSLRMKQSLYGPLDVPLAITNSMSETEKSIADIKLQLANLAGGFANPHSTIQEEEYGEEVPIAAPS